MTPLMIRVIDLLLAAEARTICRGAAAATERHHRLRGKYLANAEFRQAVKATAALVIARLQHLGADTIADILRRQAEMIAPEGADALHEELLHDYASDPDYRRYIDGLADIVEAGALQMVATGKVPRTETEPMPGADRFSGRQVGLPLMADFEFGGRGFESLRARHKTNGLGEATSDAKCSG